MQLFEKNDLYKMGAETLQKHVVELCLLREKLKKIVRIAGSEMGEYMLEVWDAKLAEIRKNYAKVSVKDKSDRDIVMAFVELRASEQHVKAEIASMRSPKKELEVLDNYHTICQDVCSERDSAKRTAR